MANGDAVLRDVVAVKYISDTGKTFLHKTLSFYQAQASLGWDLMDSATPDSAPRGLKKRVWLVWNPLNHSQRARVTIATNADYISGTINTSQVNVCYRGYEQVMTLYGMEGERQRGKITDTSVTAAIPA